MHSADLVGCPLVVPMPPLPHCRGAPFGPLGGRSEGHTPDVRLFPFWGGAPSSPPFASHPPHSPTHAHRTAVQVHRDIKPANLLCSRDCHVRLCDLGMTRSLAMPEGPQPTLTDYTSTRWYRAPEVLLGSVHYGKGVDLWGVGCVAAELMMSRPLFPGITTMNQVELILQISGRPSPQDVEALQTPYASTMLEAIPPVRPRSLPEALGQVSAECVDLVNQCIAFSPLKRCDVGAALRHPYMAEFHDPEDEPSRDGGAVRIETDDNVMLRPAEYRRKLYAEIERRRNDFRRDQLGMIKRPSQAVLQTFED